MQIYKPTYQRDDSEDGTKFTNITVWGGSLTEASKARSAAKKLGAKAETQTINIPTAKGPLIDWLNENAA
jgi:hypothetical protein